MINSNKKWDAGMAMETNFEMSHEEPSAIAAPRFRDTVQVKFKAVAPKSKVLLFYFF